MIRVSCHTKCTHEKIPLPWLRSPEVAGGVFSRGTLLIYQDHLDLDWVVNTIVFKERLPPNLSFKNILLDTATPTCHVDLLWSAT